MALPSPRSQACSLGFSHSRRLTVVPDRAARNAGCEGDGQTAAVPFGGTARSRVASPCGRKERLKHESSSRRASPPATVVVGLQFGDEGKGKIIDFLAERADVVVRFQGGANAGHTVQVGEELYKFHLLPSGVLRKRTLNVIGNGVVVDPAQLLAELEDLARRGHDAPNLRISDRAHVVMPYHKILDGLEEKAKGGASAGTTLAASGRAS